MTLAVIPARGGSQGLKRKNLLPNSAGVPLFLVSARAARDAGCQVIVSTDDTEIASVAAADGFHVHHRGPELADVPVDEVVAKVAVLPLPEIVTNALIDTPVLLVQPTVQPMTASLLEWFLREAQYHNGPDPADAQPAVLGVEDRHLLWHDGTCLTDRLERQQEAAWPVREMGVRWWPSLPLSPPRRVIVAPTTLTDVDTADDYLRLRSRLRVVCRVRATRRTGAGHLYRVLTLAEGMQHHDVVIHPTWDTEDWALDLLDERGWDHEWLDQGTGGADVFVYDVLDTARSDHTGPTVSLEDTTGYATATINAMYGHGDYQGPDYAVLRSEFLVGDYTPREDGQRVMVMFGGTDPAGLTDLTIDALPDVEVDVVRPEDRRGVADAMRNADLLITSGGRTVFEAAAVGVPTIVMCQNVRETTHTHLGVGNLNLGLGRIVDPYSLRRTVHSVLDDYDLRVDLSDTARWSVDGYGADRIRRIVEHVGLYGTKP